MSSRVESGDLLQLFVFEFVVTFEYYAIEQGKLVDDKTEIDQISGYILLDLYIAEFFLCPKIFYGTGYFCARYADGISFFERKTVEELILTDCSQAAER